MEILCSKRLDNLGIVMGTFREFGLIDLIDQKLGKNDQNIISSGEAVAAMVMNGLGFMSRPLSLSPQFFQTKALDVLFARAVNPEELNRHRLGRVLDDIHAYGCELLFSEIASHVCKKTAVDEKFTSLDTTSFSVSGEYDVDTDENEITITHGYSKDHRPDLKQAVLELVTSQDGGIPLMMKCFDGHVSDNKIFTERCKKLLHSFKCSESPRYLVGDSKLYHEGNADNLSEMKFITRIPRTYKEEKKAIDAAIAANDWSVINEENKYYIHTITHLNIPQRWIVVHSKAAISRSEKMLNRRVEKEFKTAECELMHLRNKEFGCEHDAKKELKKVSSKFKYHQLILKKVLPYARYEQVGRPKKTDIPKKIIYQIDATIVSLFLSRSESLIQHSCYIIGTNTEAGDLSAEAVIEAYKNQNASVERGFRFLKDPQFFVSSFFLKKPGRIMALLMIMTLALLIYSVAQRHLRKQLVEKKETLPNQINKPIKNPTMRWIFQLLEGIDVIYIKIKNKVEKKIMGITGLRKKIISFFFKPIQNIYEIGETG